MDQIIEVDRSVSRGEPPSSGAESRAGRSNRWLWVRLAGGLVDLGLVTWAFGGLRKDRARRRARGLPLAMGAVAGITVIDVVMALRATKSERSAAARPKNEPRLAITIDRPAAEVYAFLRTAENLPRYLSSVESARATSGGRIDLRLKSMAGRTMSCTVTLVDERPDESLSWRASAANGQPFCGGSVQLSKAPGARGTELRLALDRQLTAGGGIGRSIMRLWTREKLRNDLRRLKQLLELGRLTKSDASVHPGMHAARPSQSNTTLRAGAAS